MDEPAEESPLLGAGTGPHAFVTDLDAPVLSEDDRHHLGRVVRVRPGDALTVSDGAGRWRACRFGDELELAGEIVTVPAAEPFLTVGFALVKGERPELVVQKLTELGVDRIIPFVAERSVVRWDAERAVRHVARFRRVAREASMQSRRSRLPEIDELARFADLAATEGVAVADQGGQALTLATPTVLIGPEGGWTPNEQACARRTVALGQHVLRAETAAFTAAALLGALRAGLVRAAE